MFSRRSVRGASIVAAAAALGTAALAMPTQAQAADSFFHLTNDNSRLVIAPKTVSEGSQLVQKTVKSISQRQWRQVLNSDGSVTYVLRAKIFAANGAALNGCLDLSSDANASLQRAGAVLVVRVCDFTLSQKWQRKFQSGDGTFVLQNKLSLMNIDVDNNRPNRLGAVIIQNDVPETSQDWRRTNFVTG
ncbi:hypothetical protein GCM10029976_042150 [Kribbella albertanoniae]|uniref:Uncharacterized protein n=1 Tax=Kribbella albertanoniae TaxID=1266829 RepID=A0A4V6PAM0_9ACTN|nr:RICIN domain-containing protein [Kribbella albertanoniae]TDC34005.1 hypothetical protein E1261_04670 [Kribbella albertanoniae]